MLRCWKILENSRRELFYVLRFIEFLNKILNIFHTKKKITFYIEIFLEVVQKKIIEKSRKFKKGASIFSWRIPKESSFLGALSRKSSTQGTRSMVQKKFIVFSCYLKGAIFQGKPFNG